MTTKHEFDQFAAKVGAAFSKTVNLVATAVKLVGLVFALILIGHILLTLFGANPANSITIFFANLASSLVLWFDGLFIPQQPKLGLVVNYGLAAVFWLAAAGVVARLLRMFS